MFKESGNPFMSEEKFRNEAQSTALDGDMVKRGPIEYGEKMTVSGAVNKSLLLIALMLGGAVIGWLYPTPVLIWGSMFAALGLVIFASFKPHLSPTIAPIHAIVEGVFVGGISLLYAAAYEGIIFKAASLTVALLFLMLFLYKSGIVKVTKSFRTGVIMATGAIFLVYLASWILSIFGIRIPYLFDGGLFSIGISFVIVGVATLNLLLDFDNFDKGEQYGAPKYMEWFSAMGLLVTLVWLYVELLRLLSYLSSD